MALEEKTILDMISWRPELATIEVRMATVILRDGVEVNREYHRHVVGPGDDIENQEPEVQDLADLFANERTAAVKV